MTKHDLVLQGHHFSAGHARWFSPSKQTCKSDHDNAVEAIRAYVPWRLYPVQLVVNQNHALQQLDRTRAQQEGVVQPQDTHGVAARDAQ